MATKYTPTTTVLKRCLLGLAALLVVVATPATVTLADTYDDQIKAIEQEVAAYQNEVGRLRSEANTLANELAALTAQKNAIQKQIDLSQAEFEKLTHQITEAQIKLDNQKIALATNLQDAYVESSITPLEMVASAGSIGDYIDKQEYRNIIREQIQVSIKEIKALREELTKKQKEVERVLADQKGQREMLAAKENERAVLLAETQGQEAAYQSVISQRNDQMNAIRAEQARAYASYTRRGGISTYAGDPNKGGYPAIWANAPLDSMLDDWGMYNRECVSYAAWKVFQSGKDMPYWGGRGNAYEWIINARNEGYAWGYQPKVKSVAVWGINDIGGGYGHVAWVEIVNGDGSIEVSQYNVVPGQYNWMHVPASEVANLEFIYF